MDQMLVMDVVRQAILLIVALSAPVMIVGLLVGVAIALVQALTQIQEMTLAFVPKILIIFGMIFLLMPTMMHMMTEFMNSLSDLIIGGGNKGP